MSPEKEKSKPAPGDWKRKCAWVAVPRGAVERGASRIAEAEQAGALVESLAGCVVQRRPDALVLLVRPDVEEHRVAAAGKEAEGGSSGSGSR